MKPYAHQVVGTRFLVEHEAAALFDEMGVGKSRQVIDAACHLFSHQLIDAVVTVCPASVRTVWEDPTWGQLAQHASVPVDVVRWRSGRRRFIDGWRWDGGLPGRLPWVVANYELLRDAFWLHPLILGLEDARVMLVLDEASYLKNRQATQTKAMLELRKVCARCVLLNGTPVTHSPLDLWAPVAIMNREVWKFKNFWQFRARYAVKGGWQGKQIVKFQHLEELQATLAPHVLRREKQDCLDLPAKIYTQREAPLGPETWAKYKAMRDEALVSLGDDGQALAPHAITRLLRLSQLCGGALGGVVEDGSPETRTLTLSNEKHLALVEVVRSLLAERPDLGLIIWARFRQELDRACEWLRHKLKLQGIYRIHGGQSKLEREEAVIFFSDPTSVGPIVLVAQPQAGGFGLNLVRASQVIYLSNDYNLMTRLQSEDRCHRPGQVNPVTYTDVVATGPAGQKTIDHTILTALRAKQDLATWTVEAWKRALEED